MNVEPATTSCPSRSEIGSGKTAPATEIEFRKDDGLHGTTGLVGPDEVHHCMYEFPYLFCVSMLVHHDLFGLRYYSVVCIWSTSVSECNFKLFLWAYDNNHNVYTSMRHSHINYMLLRVAKSMCWKPWRSQLAICKCYREPHRDNVDGRCNSDSEEQKGCAGTPKRVTAFAGYDTVNRTPLQGRDITISKNGTRSPHTRDPKENAIRWGKWRYKIHIFAPDKDERH